MKKKPLTIPEQIKEKTVYIEFLSRRLASENYKANVSQEEYDKTKQKYDKAKFILKTLKESVK